MHDNDILEMMKIQGNQIAFRVVYPNPPEPEEIPESGSGSGSEDAAIEETEEEPISETEECYLGVSREDGKAKCYSSAEFAATRFIIIH